ILDISPLKLHPPTIDRALLDQPEQAVHGNTDRDYCQQAGKDICNLKLILVLIDKPADPAGTGADPENQFGRDQGTPSKGPAVLESGQNGGESGRDEDLQYIVQTSQPVVAPDHPDRTADGGKAGVGTKRHRPYNSVNQHESDAAVAKAEPEQCQWQQGNCGQRVEHGGQHFQQVIAEAGTVGKSRQNGSQHNADGITA